MTIIDKNDFLGSRISIAPGSLPLLPSTRMKASSPATPAGVVPAHSPGTSSVSFVVVTHRKLQKSVSTNPKVSHINSVIFQNSNNFYTQTLTGHF